MKVFRGSMHLIQELNNAKFSNKTIGFVPTMGALHNGHAQLIKQAKDTCDICVVSIFVNPTQFNNKEDLENYPITEEDDLHLLEKIGCDLVFLPSVKEMYPNGSKVDEFDFHGLETKMEGAHRPGHFAGVATIVNRFFELIQPNHAFFGEKDFQQLLIVKEIARQKHPNLEIVGVPIVREDDGLAMSSRNRRLTTEFRLEAPLIFKSLQEVKSLFINEPLEEIYKRIETIFAQSILELEYFEIVNESDLIKVESKESNKSYRAFMAVFAGDIRLIDNIAL